MKNSVPVSCNVDFSGKDLEALLEFLPGPLRGHSRRVAVCSAIMSEYAVDLKIIPVDCKKSYMAELMHLGGTCHDIGKLMIPILLPNKDEYIQHTAIGAEFLEKYKDSFFRCEVEVNTVLDMVLYHHEQPNGKGFPNGLHAKDIHPAAGICAVANAFDHFMITENPAPINLKDASTHIIHNAGILFCEMAAVCFEQALPQLLERYGKWKTL